MLNKRQRKKQQQQYGGGNIKTIDVMKQRIKVIKQETCWFNKLKATLKRNTERGEEKKNGKEKKYTGIVSLIAGHLQWMLNNNQPFKKGKIKLIKKKKKNVIK